MDKKRLIPRLKSLLNFRKIETISRQREKFLVACRLILLPPDGSNASKGLRLFCFVFFIKCHLFPKH